MDLIVEKYGGTSVGSIEKIRHVAERIAGHAKQGKKIAVVVSAMAGETNRLIDLVQQANPRATAKSHDMVVAAGEQVSVGLVCSALEGCSVEAEPLLGHQLSVITDNAHSRAKIQSIDTKKILAAWERNAVPVIAGFQGVTADLDVTTLGRGGSDTSAVALAVALGADICEINTDVAGVFSADPRLVPTAHLIDELDYDTALELAALGGKVLHSRCVEIGAKYKMPIVVRNTFDPDEGRRTRIMAFEGKEAIEAPVVSAISLDEDVVRVAVSLIHKTPTAMAELFGAIADRGVNVDIIVHNAHSELSSFNVGFTVTRGNLTATLEVIGALQRNLDFKSTQVSVTESLAKVSAVGLGMKSHSGVASRVFQTLSSNGIDLQMVSTSEIKISCVVPLADGKRSVQALHQSFF